ncbi:endo-1,6-alpha-mannosidase [Lyophyllum atratum]|nr:endo-1,6-alpha-mannosidase [Lyophyllum atratum]
MLLSAPVVLIAIGLVAAQDLGVPLSWRKFSNSRPLSERITLSQNAINAILPQLNSATGEFNGKYFVTGIGYWQSGNVWSAMANQDRLAGTTTNKAQVVNNLKNVFNLRKNYDQYGIMTMRYGGQQRRYMPTGLMETLPSLPTPSRRGIMSQPYRANSALTAAQANAGQLPGKSFSIAPTCDGVTMAGGVFWRPTADDQGINSITTGLYVTVSAFLAEITRDSKYTSAAIQSANWIKAHNMQNNLVLDTVNGHDCSRSPASWLFTYNSGKFIEGLSVLADVTGDSQWRTLSVNIAAAAMKSAPWQGSDGIVTEGVSTTSNNDGVGFKAIYIRGLCEAFARNPSNSDLRILIHSYADVQYNALLDLAATGSTYSSNWHGPPQSFTSWGQLAALDVFTTAILAN